MQTLIPLDLGIGGSGKVHRNMPVSQLVQKALELSLIHI